MRIMTYFTEQKSKSSNNINVIRHEDIILEHDREITIIYEIIPSHICMGWQLYHVAWITLAGLIGTGLSVSGAGAYKI